MVSDLAINSEAAHIGTVSTDLGSDRALILRLVRFGIFCLPLLAFTIPDRDSPLAFASIDALAFGKIIALLVVAVIGGLLLLRQLVDAKVSWDQSDLTTEPRVWVVLRAFMPYFVFLGWAIFSVLWTPRPSVTLGQAGGMAGLLMIASLVSLLSFTKDGTEMVLKSLVWSLLLFGALLLAIHILEPNLSGLDRRMLIAGSDGVVHPTAAAANSSLGLLVAVSCWLVQRYQWAGRLAFAAICIHGTVLFLASSRTALGMTLITIPLLVVISGDNRRRAWIGMGMAAVALVMLLVDPGFRLFSTSENVGLSYVTRGQSLTQLQKFSGREEMWSKVWDEYLESPVKGHGYFLTSSTGEMEVWDMKANHSAHNIYLQVVSGTGVIGLTLFLIAMATLLKRFLTLRNGDAAARRMFQMLLVVMVWFFGWSLLSASFMGPVRSESVCFYTFLGLGIGQWVRMDATVSPTQHSGELANA